jgi:transcriptional regulator with XRE-family HTH domain
MAVRSSPANLALGRAIRSAREAAGCTQESFAEQIGMGYRNYGSIERGEYNRTVDTLVKVAAGLGFRLSELFSRAGL